MLKYVFFWAIFFSTIFLYSVSYFYELPVSFYSICFALLLFIQLLYSFLNRRNQEYILKQHKLISYPYIDVIVVGYRENVEYWKACLNSVKNQTYKNINVIISIDGNEDDDLYMYTVAKNILPFSIILMNKHGGKRSAIIHGYNYIHTHKDVRSKHVILVDSDTILDKYAVINLVSCIEDDDEIGCATGNIRIFNRNSNFLTRIISARYAYAFNIERSYLSFLSIMNCCSGPLSIYRKSLITKDFIDKFKNQSMFGVNIEPGDDRHQTLQILMSGYKSKMTPFAIAYTETPSHFERFLRQQLRWMRSFYRESYWQYKSLENQPLFLSCVTVYELLFPFFIATFLLYSINFGNYILLLKSGVITVSIALLRTAILCLYTKSLDNIYNFFYLFVYLLFLIPAKIYASMTFLNNDWKTSNRFKLIHNKSLDTFLLYICIICWISMIFVNLALYVKE